MRDALRHAVFVLAAAFLWTNLALDAVRHGVGAGSPLPPAALAAGAVGAALLGAFAESGAYSLVWRALGRRYRFGWAALSVFELSVLEVLSLTLVWRAQSSPDDAAWLAWLAGSRVGGTAGRGALALAFGSAGLLTALRTACNAGIQARAADVSWRRAAVVVVLGWLLTRLVLWWTVDLVSGPLPGRLS